ncbi:hypothetical protein [Blautia sp. 1033sp1_1033st1_G9_1033SCRN_220408]|uniref:hypothetical protein n=1 Tax=Blautia sp. 1033sp1_1033st1_G9_1033SCRN_220408 TaxID=3144490 RepID=UPI0034A252E6
MSKPKAINRKKLVAFIFWIYKKIQNSFSLSVQNEQAAINEIDVQRVPGRFPWQVILPIEAKEKMQK